jgi:dihydrofolate reductase
MGKLIVSNQITVNGAFESPSPDEWLVLDEDSGEASLEQLILSDALVLGRKTYEGLAAVWPELTGDPALERLGGRAREP